MAARNSRTAPAGPTWDQVDLAPIVLIRGAERLLAERAVDRLIAQARAADADTEVTRLEVAAYEPHQLETLVSPSLFGEPRLVVINELEKMNDALLTDLLDYVPRADPDVSVILRHGGGVRGKKLLDLIGTSKYPVVTCQEIKSPKDKAALVQADFKRARRQVEPAAVQALVDALGNDLQEMCSAVSQLVADTDGTVTVEHVNTYYAGRVEATGFSVADAAVTGNVGRTITALRHAVATGTDPVLIVSALATKFRQLARVAAAGGRNLGPKELGMAPWQIDRARRELHGWNDNALATCILAIARADAEVKGASRDPVHAVECAVLSICAARGR